jgi:RHS repeat-associated protein
MTNEKQGLTNTLSDHLGSVRQVVDPTTAVALAQSFDPFGQVLEQAGSAQSIFGYTGEQTDPTRLVFLRARYYNPSIGRFLTADSVVPDPLSSRGWNRYAYVENNPINRTDPSGHCIEPISGIGCISVGALVGDIVTIAVAAYLIYDSSRDSAQNLESIPALPPGQFTQPTTPPVFRTDEVFNQCYQPGPNMGRPSIWELPPFSLTPPYFGPVVPGVPIEGPSTFGNNILSVTPTTHPNDFEPVTGTKAKRHKTTGEFWYPDLFHGDHWEVYKNK